MFLISNKFSLKDEYNKYVRDILFLKKALAVLVMGQEYVTGNGASCIESTLPTIRSCLMLNGACINLLFHDQFSSIEELASQHVVGEEKKLMPALRRKVRLFMVKN